MSEVTKKGEEFFDIPSRVFLGKFLSEFKENPNMSMQFYT
jgi:hypothetical protein